LGLSGSAGSLRHDDRMTEPTEPTGPTGPTEPTEPTGPTEPTEPTGPPGPHPLPPAALLRWSRAAGAAGEYVVPAWLRPHRGEQRWSVLAVIVLAIALQLALPDEFVLRPRTGAPVLEAALCVVLLVRNPGSLREHRPALRTLSLVLIGILAATNAVSTGLLVYKIVTGLKLSATKVLASGAAIWITNVIAYALWYWEFDRGGPVSRALALKTTPDLLFPQIADDRLDPDWSASFVDYLYVSFTNASAFSAADTLPLTPWAKMLMMTQATVSLVTIGLVAARAVGVLPAG